MSFVGNSKHVSKLLKTVELKFQLYVLNASSGNAKLLPNDELSQKIKLSFSQIEGVEKTMFGIG